MNSHPQVHAGVGPPCYLGAGENLEAALGQLPRVDAGVVAELGQGSRSAWTSTIRIGRCWRRG